MHGQVGHALVSRTPYSLRNRRVRRHAIDFTSTKGCLPFSEGTPFLQHGAVVRQICSYAGVLLPILLAYKAGGRMRPEAPGRATGLSATAQRAVPYSSYELITDGHRLRQAGQGQQLWR